MLSEPLFLYENECACSIGIIVRSKLNYTYLLLWSCLILYIWSYIVTSCMSFSPLKSMMKLLCSSKWLGLHLVHFCITSTEQNAWFAENNTCMNRWITASKHNSFILEDWKGGLRNESNPKFILELVMKINHRIVTTKLPSLPGLYISILFLPGLCHLYSDYIFSYTKYCSYHWILFSEIISDIYNK